VGTPLLPARSRAAIIPLMRKVSPLGVLAFANFATAGLGVSFLGEDGKFSVSNLAPLLFIAAAGPAFLVDVKTIGKNIVSLFLFFNTCALASFAIFMFRFGWQPNAAVLLFQDAEFIFVLLLVWYARRNYEEFFAVARAGIVCSALISVVYGIAQFGRKELVVNVIQFGMDDKSQASVLFCCQAYILLRYFDGLISRIFAAGLLAMSLMTLSRLPALFMPVLLITLSLRSRYGMMLAAATVCGAIAAFVAYGDELTTVFRALDRLTSVDQATGDDATSAHVLLIKSALEMKFTDVSAFFFGTGPGNFSKALTSFPIDIHELESLDPTLVSEARLGRAPMHSTPVSLLLDYNIAIIALLVYLALRAVRYLLQGRHYLDLVFFLTLFGASTFYSLHNKPYFYLCIATVAVATMGRIGEEERARAAFPRPAAAA
jgi:hypothetical protein